MSVDPEGTDFDNWLFLALAEHHQGHTDAAKAAAAKARAARAPRKDIPAWDRAEVEQLAAELGSVLPAGK